MGTRTWPGQRVMLGDAKLTRGEGVPLRADAELTRWGDTGGSRKRPCGDAGRTRKRPWGVLGVQENDPGQGEGRGPRRPSAAHLRVGHNQALVAFAVVPPFILIHLPLVHTPVEL